MAKGKGGFIGQDGLNAPNSPSAVSATAGNAQATVSFTAPSDVGGSAITGYSVVSNTGATTISGSITASYDSKSFNVGSQEGGPGGVQFKSDGTKMYVTGQTADKTFQYSLSTPYDVSTASYDSVELNHATQASNANPYDLFFKTDGTKLYVMFGVNDTVYQYSLSSAWDLSTASYDSVNFSVASQESGEPGGLAFSDDGSKMYACGEGQGTVFQYTLSTPWDLSTASYASKSFDVSDQGTKPAGLAFAKNGQLMIVIDEGQVKVFLYALSTAFDVSTATYTSSSFSVSSQDPRPFFVALANSNTKMYAGGVNNDIVYQYTVDFSVGYPTSSPVIITGLSNGTSYTFNVWAINAFGFSAPSDASGSVSPAAPQIAVFAHSNAGLDQFNMATEGSVTDFGTISLGESTSRGAVGSATRGVFGGGQDSNVMTYITFSSAGNGTDFGDQGESANGQSGMGNSTRGIFSGGAWDGSTNKNFMDYITIASTGNSTTFGDLTQARRYLRGCASPTRGLNGSGYQSSFTGRIDYVTIASTGNATTFGTLSPTYVGYGGAACSSSTRAIWAGGSASNIANNISYVTIASTGNSTDFGDLTENKYSIAGCTNSTTAYFFGGQGSSGAVQNIDKITIASTGNATDTGVDVKTTSSTYGMAASGSHGGIS
jgi:sugar lactone lactonase YvrE